jgi:hypothetical protein
MNPECIYNGIKQLIDSDELRRKLSQNLFNEELGTEKEIEKLYNMFD